MKKFKTGDRCRIIGNTSNHFFKIGQDVVLNGRVSENGFYEANDMNSSFWVKPEDMELIEPDLTLQEKFEQGWEIRHKNSNAQVEDLHIMKNGKICVAWGNNSAGIYPDAKNFEDYHTITPPAPKVEKIFTEVYVSGNGVYAYVDCKTIEEAKENIDEKTTCILEHEKQGDKWVFVKAHNI